MLYWATTGLVAAFLAASAGSYVLSPSTIEGIRELGFPDFFRIQLAVLKVMAVPVLLIPQVPMRVKEWGYAGVALFLLTAMIAHYAHRDPIALNLINLALLALLITSYLSMPS
ncbi:MAG: DoxX family protein [Acidobacteriota bacterium]